jgi:predicted metal-dependent peptidase
MSKKTNVLDTNVLRFVTNMASRSVNKDSSKTEENSSSAESDKEQQPRMQFEYSEKIDAEEIDLLEGSLKLLNSSESDNVVKNSGINEEEAKKHESVFSFKILSKAENEFLTGSSNGRENFVKGCKWLGILMHFDNLKEDK